MTDPRECLRDILDAVERIERYARRGRRAYDDHELIQDWIAHHLQIIGEAPSRLGASRHTASTFTRAPARCWAPTWPTG